MTAPATLLQDWRNDSRCRDTDPELFFPDPTDHLGNVQAKEFCKPCPVRAECLRWAVDNDIRHGVWGGLLPEERGVNTRHTVIHPRCCRDCGEPFYSRREIQVRCSTCSKAHQPNPARPPKWLMEHGRQIAELRASGASDREIGRVFGTKFSTVSKVRHALGIALDGTVDPSSPLAQQKPSLQEAA